MLVRQTVTLATRLASPQNPVQAVGAVLEFLHGLIISCGKVNAPFSFNLGHLGLV